jgi:primosomal protein N' (replication factor Y)
VRLEIRHARAAAAQSAAEDLSRKIRGLIEAEEHQATEIIGPAPCFFSRTNTLYRWQLILRGPDPVAVVRALPPAVLADWRVEVDPPSLL